jgi:hypothetical protein
MAGLFDGLKPVRFGDMIGPHQDRPSVPRRPARSKALLRRLAFLREADDVLAFIPAEGETLHALMTGRYDLMHLLVALLRRLPGPCERLRIATLSLSARNVREMARLLDDGTVKALDLLASHFFARHEKAIYAACRAELVRDRGARLGIARSHCKIITIAGADGGRFVLEGSPNLRTNSNVEQFSLTRDAALHEWFDTWVRETITRHEIGPTDDPAAG